MWQYFLNQPKNRQLAVTIALLSIIIPLPIAGIHKFYLGQPLWGIIYLLLGSTPIPRLASAIDIVWYLLQDQAQFQAYFNQGLNSDLFNSSSNSHQVLVTSQAVRELDKLRQEGLIS
ncbi:MAG: NINE protein, partial [Cyanobacteria bacterium J149]